jgi:hypothetical protein
MSQVLSLCLRNGGLTQYGSWQGDLIVMPATDSGRIRTRDGSALTRQARLESAALEVPYDNRSQEINQALLVSSVALACTSTDLIGMHDVAPWANALLTGMVFVGLVDNVYDVLKGSSTFLVDQVANQIQKSKDGKSNESKGSTPFSLMLPDKADLPFGLGSGQLTGTVVRGLTRLTTVDAEREALCEGAALAAAYGLGLPSFAYRPNAIEAVDMVLQSSDESGSLGGSLLTNVGIMRVLVWLLSPVAAESSKYPVCIMSNPQEAIIFLQKLMDLAQTRSDVQAALDGLGLYTGSEDDVVQEREDLMKWAFLEADQLLRDNRKALQEVTDRLAGGAATIGDCIAVVEDW